MTAALAWLWRITARSNCPLICIKTPSMAANKWFVFRSRSGPHCLISSVLSRIPSAWAHFLSPQQRRKHTSARSQRRHNSTPTPSSGRWNSRCLTAVLHVNKPHRQSKKKNNNTELMSQGTLGVCESSRPRPSTHQKPACTPQTVDALPTQPRLWSSDNCG